MVWSGIICIDGGYVFQAVTLFPLFQHLEGGDDSMCVIFFITFCHGNDVAIKFFRMLGKITN